MQKCRNAEMRNGTLRRPCHQPTARRGPAFLRVCIVAFAAAAFVFPGGRAAVAQEVIDRILAVASGEVITLSDVRIARDLGRVRAEGSADPVRVALSQLIDRALVLSEAERFAPPEPAAAAVDAELATVISRFGSRQALDAALARLGVDVPYVRELLRQDLRIRAYLDQRFTADTAAQQQLMVDEWVAGLRRRSDVVDLYGELSGPAPGTGAPVRD
jgi:hypothetical protein